MPCPPHPREIAAAAADAKAAGETLRHHVHALQTHGKAVLAFWGRDDERGRALAKLLRRPPRKRGPIEIWLCKARTLLAQMAAERRFPAPLQLAQRREMALHSLHRKEERAAVVRGLANEARRLKKRQKEVAAELKRVRTLSVGELRRDRECLLPKER